MSLKFDVSTVTFFTCLLVCFCVHAEMNDTIRGQLLTMHNVVRQLAMYGLIPGQPKAVYMNPLVRRIYIQYTCLMSPCFHIYYLSSVIITYLVTNILTSDY